MRKSFFALPAAAALAACIMPLPAFAQQSWEITVQDTGAEITWTDADAVHAQIPAQADGQEVTAIAEDEAEKCKSAKEVIKSLTAQVRYLYVQVLWLFFPV